MSNDGKIHIKAKRKEYAQGQPVIKISTEAYNALVDICNESSISMKEVASLIIMQSLDRIVYDRED